MQTGNRIMPSPSARTYAIHPAIGVARLGNLEVDPENAATYYLGPEAPYEVANDGGRYKAGGRMKKQAQRFRIYEFENGRATREITLAAEDVRALEWTVHLANRKAALDPDAKDCAVSTTGVPRSPDAYRPASTRNRTIKGDARRNLAIDPGAQTVDQPGAVQDCTGRFGLPDGKGGMQFTAVTLGKLRMEPATGRLLVFAGDGTSQGFHDGVVTSAPGDWANSDGWHDDTADGRVTARISFADGSVVSLDQPEQAAWVLCTAPKYTPGMGYFTTLHDLAIDAGPGAKPERPSFMRDIYPILRSVSRLRWVNQRGAEGHRPGRADYLVPGAMQQLADPDRDANSDAARRRSAIFNRLRSPHGSERERYLMPRLPESVVEDTDEPYDIAAVTPLQYAMLKKWCDGDFVNDYEQADAYVPLERMAVAEQPCALDRGALEGTAGTPLYPGIESWQIMRDSRIYAAPLRFVARTRPGDLTIGNALPWQADFLDCDDTWWPVQRPNDVVRDGAAGRWIPDGWGEGEENPSYEEMVRQWWRLGMVVSRDGGASFAEEDGSAEAVKR